MNTTDKKLLNNINIKRYIEIVSRSDYYKFYKLLKEDSIIIRDLLSKINLDDDEIYFNFIINFWNNLKVSKSEESLDLCFYIDKYTKCKSSFKFESYKDYYERNSEKVFIKNSTDIKVINLRVNIYIHQKAIERLITEEIKSEFSIQNEDVDSEFFLNKILKNPSSIYKSSINVYSIDFYGNYVDTSIRYEELNYFFYVCILTKTFIIIKPIKINYKNVYHNDKEIVYKFLLNDISKIRFSSRCIQYVFKNGKVLNMELTNCGMFRFKKTLIKYSKEKEIDFEIKNTNNIINKKSHTILIFSLICFLLLSLQLIGRV